MPQYWSLWWWNFPDSGDLEPFIVPSPLQEPNSKNFGRRETYSSGISLRMASCLRTEQYDKRHQILNSGSVQTHQCPDTWLGSPKSLRGRACWVSHNLPLQGLIWWTRGQEIAAWLVSYAERIPSQLTPLLWLLLVAQTIYVSPRQEKPQCMTTTLDTLPFWGI